MVKQIRIWVCIAGLLLAACTSSGNEVTRTPTVTIEPLFTLTPRLTATPVQTSTPLPTFTPIPSETPIPPTPSDTPTPTPTAPIEGIISSVQTVNVREGPGTTFSAIRALVPGTGVEVLSQNLEGTWFNIKMEDGTEGWVSSRLIFLPPTATPFPTITPSPNLTALALGTPLPTAVIGGGTITPTPPLSAVSATPAIEETEVNEDVTPTETNVFLPVIDIDAINQTATALAAGVIVQISPPAPAETGQSPNVLPTGTEVQIRVVTETPTPEGFRIPDTPTPPSRATAEEGTPGTPTATFTPLPPGSAVVGQGVDVFAMCDNAAFGIPAPSTIAAGSTIEVYWAWFVTDPSLIDQHVEAVSYQVRVNDELLPNWQQYGQRTVPAGDGYAKYWYVPYGPLDAGTYTITYEATWGEQISDGYDVFGPGTRNLTETGSCTFVVR